MSPQMSHDGPLMTDLAHIRRLVEAYAIAMDENDLDAFDRIFVPEGALVVLAPGRDEPLGTFQGPGPEGVGLVSILMDQLYRNTLHHITTHVATVDGEGATGVTYCLAYHMVDGADGGELETLGVRYEDEYVRTPQGWRMGTRRATRLWSQITPTPRLPLLVDRAAAANRANGDGGIS
jgi:hypothetical protein